LLLTVGLAGFGGIGRVPFSNYGHIADSKVIAVCEPSPEGRKAAEEKGVPCYDSLKAMIAQAKPDVVDVCTPTFLHHGMVMEALGNGINVICEKPLALSSKDAREMYALAEKQGVQLLVGHVLQFYPASKILHEIVRDRRYGKALDAVFLRLSACPRWAKEGWLLDKGKSGLLPFDLHIHDLDLMISLFGKPESFQIASGGREGLAYEEYYRVLYRYPQLNVCCEAAWYNAGIPFTASWRVYFEKAVLVCEGGKLTAFSFDEAPKEFDIEEKIKIPTGINLPPTGVFYEELKFFLDRISSGAKEQYRKDEIISLIEILEHITGGKPEQ
jgi:predicted dehydrogenase